MVTLPSKAACCTPASGEVAVPAPFENSFNPRACPRFEGSDQGCSVWGKVKLAGHTGSLCQAWAGDFWEQLHLEPHVSVPKWSQSLGSTVLAVTVGH